MEPWTHNMSSSCSSEFVYTFYRVGPPLTLIDYITSDGSFISIYTNDTALAN